MHWFQKHGESMNSFRAAVKASLNKSPDLPSGIQVGDLVEVKATANTYYPGGATIPSWVKTDSYHVVTQVVSNGKSVVKGGKTCVLLGKKVDKKTGKESAGIMSWIDQDALKVIENYTQGTAKTSGAQKYYRVQVGAFANKGNAESLLKKLKTAGFNGLIKFE